MNLRVNLPSKAYIAFLLALVVALSVLQGRYTLDPHHWGLMLSNAKDLWSGKLPYREIFIQYGILTTIIQAAAFGLSPRLLSGITVTAICYAVGLWLAYCIARHVLAEQKSALYVLTGLVLFHPIAIYPWANYIAFPFLMAGLYGLMLRQSSWIACFLSGVSFGLAILARENLAPAVCLLILLTVVYDGMHRNQNPHIYRCIAIQILGLALPLGLFFLYLWQNHLLEYWQLLAIELPVIYADESFQHLQEGSVFKNILSAVFQGWRKGEIRWILVTIIWVVNAFVFLSILIPFRHSPFNANLALLSLATLLLISSSLHLTELFRIATASSIGLITVYALLERHSRAAFYFFVISSIWLTATLGQNRWSGTNYFLPSEETLALAKPIIEPTLFQGSLWSPQAQEYYSRIEHDLMRLKNSSCDLSYHYNATRDSFFAVLSPFKSVQIAPYATSARIDQLRPDLDYARLMNEAQNIVLFQMIPKEVLPDFQVPTGFSIYSQYPTPIAWQMPEHQVLLLAIPSLCARILNKAAQ